MLFGAKTGRDGIGGASVLASAELDDSEDKRPTVQIGDPFTEKKLLECSLELLDRGLLVALQDLGAAGLTSSSAEMAAKGEVGLDLDVRRVPLREADMEPFEIMISESQERMLCVVEPEQLEAVLAVCARWEVDGTAIGEVTATRPPAGLRRRRAGRRPAGRRAGRRVPGLRPRARRARDAAVPGARAGAVRRGPGARCCSGCSSSANLASRQWAFEQYDCDRRLAHRPPARGRGRRRAAVPTAVGDNVTGLYPPVDGDGPRPAIAVAIDGNGRRVAADPYRGAVEAVRRVRGQPRLRRRRAARA